MLDKNINLFLVSEVDSIINPRMHLLAHTALHTPLDSCNYRLNENNAILAFQTAYPVVHTFVDILLDPILEPTTKIVKVGGERG